MVRLTFIVPYFPVIQNTEQHMALSSPQHVKKFYPETEAGSLLRRLLTEVPWTEKTWGNGRKLPRKVYSYAEIGRIGVLDLLIAKIESTYGTHVQSVWCNLYQTGKDWTPPHKDSYGCSVYTLSFGVTRDFWICHDKTKKKTVYPLSSGDLFYFDEETNRNHTHCLPKSDSIGPRVSIVFFGTKPGQSAVTRGSSVMFDDDESDFDRDMSRAIALSEGTLSSSEPFRGEGRSLVEDEFLPGAAAAAAVGGAAIAAVAVEDNDLKKLREARLRRFVGPNII